MRGNDFAFVQFGPNEDPVEVRWSTAEWSLRVNRWANDMEQGVMEAAMLVRAECHMALRYSAASVAVAP